MPRLRRRLESLAKKPSTALSQEDEVGVKWKVKRGWAIEPFAELRVLMGCIVVEDDVDGLVGGDLRLDLVEEAHELLMPMLLHAAPDDFALEDIEGGEERGGAVALVIVRHGGGASLLQWQARLGAVECLDLALFVDR
jgi:hypothetical protein